MTTLISQDSELTMELIQQARERMQRIAFETWVFRSRHFDQECNSQLFFKAENMQRSGSIKFRSAFNKIKVETERVEVRRVVSLYVGDLGEAVALAGKLMSLPTIVVMPEDRSIHHQKAVKEYGAGIKYYDSRKDNPAQIALSLQEEPGVLLIPPVCDSLMLAGEGTAISELLEEVPDLDEIIVPVTSGGLLAAAVVAMKYLRPGKKVTGVAVSGRDKMSFDWMGLVLEWNEHSDAIEAILKENNTEIVTVTEDQVLGAQNYILQRMKILVEPAGAAAAAALLYGVLDRKEKKLGIILNGGNADLDSLAKSVKVSYEFSSQKSNKGEYLVSCYNCTKEYNAADTIWCNCITEERTLVCVHCLSCFCKASLSYKTLFWQNAPQELWDMRMQDQNVEDFSFVNPAPPDLTWPAILIVDHDKHIQKAAIRGLQNLGYGVIVANDGEEGLELTKQYLPDLVLTDALMPRVDGRQMCLKIKSDPRTAHIKVVIVTALYTQAKYRTQAFSQFHADEYLNKPVTFNDLRAVLDRFLPQRDE